MLDILRILNPFGGWAQGFWFRKVKLRDDQSAAVLDGCRRLAELDSPSSGFHPEFHPLASGRRAKLYEVATENGLLFVRVASECRPCKWACVVMTEDAQRVLLPSHESAAFEEVCGVLGATAQSERNRVASVVGPLVSAPR